MTVDFDGRQKRTYQVNARERRCSSTTASSSPTDCSATARRPSRSPRTDRATCTTAPIPAHFSLEEDLTGTGNEIFVRRRYFRLLPGRPGEDQRRPRAQGLALLATPEAAADIYRRVPLRAGEELQSGDLLEVELFLESKNDYDYLAFEDLKPAGCEPVELRSGGREENGLWSHMELRDQKVAFFLSSLPQGTRTLTYRLRAENSRAVPRAAHPRLRHVRARHPDPLG